ncbi:MAG: hypothetical protein QOC66_2872 [Pseudonocardiales bacterium]|nr:hypothetical protein [Pseudonocardiales bacterium]
MGAVAALVAVVIGVIIIVQVNSSDSTSGTHSVTYLKSVLDKVPLPAGAALAEETANESHGDLNAYVERKYTLASPTNPSDQVRAALQKAGCRLVDLQTREVLPITATDWAARVSATSGDLHILPPGTSGGGVDVQWKDAALYLSVKGGDVESS